MPNWVEQAKELLAVLGENPTVSIKTAEARERFKSILEGATSQTVIIKHYHDARAVVMSPETFEAMRQLTLLLSRLVEEQEPEAELRASEAPSSAEDLKVAIDDGIKAARQHAGAKSRFRKQTVGAR